MRDNLTRKINWALEWQFHTVAPQVKGSLNVLC